MLHTHNQKLLSFTIWLLFFCCVLCMSIVVVVWVCFKSLKIWKSPSQGKNQNREKPITESFQVSLTRNCGVKDSLCGSVVGPSSLEWGLPIAGVRPLFADQCYCFGCLESRIAWDRSPKMGGKLHPRLNTVARPIANKYREGKLKRTLKREFNSTWNRIGVNGWKR